jgi:hypothetical protein
MRAGGYLRGVRENGQRGDVVGVTQAAARPAGNDSSDYHHDLIINDNK